MEIIYKTILAILLLIVVFSLGQALFYMMTDRGKGTRTVWALTRRISLSLLVIVMIVIGSYMGWLHPHGIDPAM
ncbi:twin transmembrane helix small protein [Frateuria aurantia]